MAEEESQPKVLRNGGNWASSLMKLKYMNLQTAKRFLPSQDSIY